MKISFYKIIFFIFLALGIQFFSSPVFAAEFNKDLSVGNDDFKIPSDVLKGESVRLYATIHNNSNNDLSGVVKFYDEFTKSYIGTDQPISIVTKKTDDVFVDFNSDSVGAHQISVRLVPWDASGDDPNNNKITKTIYVDIDTDHDGIPDRLDSDIDGDGVPNAQDAFPLDSKEWKDTDHDGIGDNADPDDDNDGHPDVSDAFPTNPKEWKDSDGDGVGDNSDAFPFDPKETKDSDHDGIGDNSDPYPNNHGPIPLITVSDSKKIAGEPITFSAINSSDPDGSVVKFEWDFGDGSKDTGVIVDHIFRKSGDYFVTLKVTDNTGESRDIQLSVKISSGKLFIALLITTLLLILMLLGLFIPASRFYYKKLRGLTNGKKTKTSGAHKKF
jgi:hypothetical protein